MKSNQVDLTLFVHTLPRTSIDQNGAYKYPPDQKNNYDSKHVLSTRCCHIIWKYLQSCAKVDIWNKKKKLRTVAKIKPQGYKNCRLPKFSANVTPPLYTATTLFNEPRSQRPFGTSDWQNYSSRLAWLLSQAVTWFATDCNVQRKKSSFAKVKWSNSIKINTPVAVQ